MNSRWSLLVPQLLLLPFLGIAAILQLLLLCSVLNLSETSSSGESRYFLQEFARKLLTFSESESLEYARYLKAEAEKNRSDSPDAAEKCLLQALKIESDSRTPAWQSYLDSMEKADTLSKLAQLKLDEEKDKEALRYLEKCYEEIKSHNLYWMVNEVQLYLEQLKLQGMQERAVEVSKQIALWKNLPRLELEKYIESRQQTLKYLPGGMEHGGAIPFISDYYRTLERDFALSGRLRETREYAESFVEIDGLLPESSWHEPTDLAELALVYSELGLLPESYETYQRCLNFIIQSDDPDILLILPQRQACASLCLLLNKKDEYYKAEASAKDIVRFLTQLDSTRSVDDTDNSTWRIGDPVRVNWDERWWASEIVGVKEKHYKLHFIGFPQSQDEFFDRSKMRRFSGVPKRII